MSGARREEKEGSAGQEREGGDSERDGEASEGDTGKKAHGGRSMENVSPCDCSVEGICLSKCIGSALECWKWTAIANTRREADLLAYLTVSIQSISSPTLPHQACLEA